MSHSRYYSTADASPSIGATGMFHQEALFLKDGDCSTRLTAVNYRNLIVNEYAGVYESLHLSAGTLYMDSQLIRWHRFHDLKALVISIEGYCRPLILRVSLVKEYLCASFHWSYDYNHS